MLPFFAAVLPVIILFCGLAIDVGMLQLKKLQMQSAADAGALGAEMETERGTGKWVLAGKLDAGLNGFTDGVNNVTVSVAVDPAENAYAGDYSAVQVTITQEVGSYFLGALNGGKTTIRAKGVALIPPCSYFMGATSLAQYPFYLASAAVYLPCPMYANRAIGVDGFGTLDAANGGNVAGPQGASYMPGHYNPPPRYDAKAMADPLAYLTAPAFSPPCNHVGFTQTGGQATLNPGTYCQGINLKNSTVHLNPGLYIITGGARWTTSTVTGTGVTMFFTKGGGASYGQLIMETGTVVNLSAPSDASLNGRPTILIFGDRNWVNTDPHGQDFRMIESSFTGDGIWYITGTGLYNWHSTFTGTNYLGFDVDNMYIFAADIRPLNNYSNIPTGNPFRPLGGLVQ